MKTVSFLKRLAAFSVAAASLFTFVSCSSSVESYEVLTYNGKSITNNSYNYELSVTKTTFLYSYMGDSSNISDVSEIWDVEISKGITLSDSLKESVYRTSLLKLFYFDYAEKNGISLSDTDLKEIDDSCNKIKNAFKSNGEFLDYLLPYSLDDELLLQYLKEEKLAAKVKTKVFTSGGEFYIPDSQIIDVFHNTYATIKHVYINNVNKTLLNGKTIPLTEDEKAEKQTLIDSILLRLENGENINDLISEQSQDEFYKSRPNGLTFRKGETGINEIDTAVFNSSVGDIFAVYTTSGAYIIEKLPLYEMAIADVISKLRNEIIYEKENEFLKTIQNGIVKNMQFFDGIDVKSLPLITI